MSKPLLFTVLVALTLAGCFPIALPPVSASIEEGAVVGGDEGGTWISTTRVGMDPLQAIPSLKDRSYDGGFGLVKESGGTISGRGWYLSGGFYPFRSIDSTNGSGVRLGMIVTADLLTYDVDTRAGMSVSTRLDLILSNQISSISNCRATVKLIGETAISIQLTAAYRSRGYWTTSAGLVFRLPGAGGLVSVANLCGDQEPAAEAAPAGA